MVELPDARIEPQTTIEHVLVVAEPVGRGFVGVGRVVGFAVRISLVAALPALVVALYALLG